MQKQDGTVEQINHYYPFGELFTDNTSSDLQPYKYSGKEIDRHYGLNLYDFSARHYDPTTGRWWNQDPMGEKYYSLTPYTYCANSPINMIDIDGRRVIAVSNEAQRMILNTLPLEYRQYISFNKDGLIKANGLVNIESNSNNFNSLRTMVLSEMTVNVVLNDRYEYVDQNGNKKSHYMNYLGVDQYFIGNDNGRGIAPSTGETGLLGKTLFPDKNGLQNSLNNSLSRL